MDLIICACSQNDLVIKNARVYKILKKTFALQEKANTAFVSYFFQNGGSKKNWYNSKVTKFIHQLYQDGFPGKKKKKILGLILF